MLLSLFELFSFEKAVFILVTVPCISMFSATSPQGRAARLRGKVHDIQSICAALAIDHPIVDPTLLEQWFNPPNTLATARMAFVTDRDLVQQFVLPLGGHFVLMTTIQVEKDPAEANNLVAIGSITDEIGQVTPVCVDLVEFFLSGFVSLVSRKDARTFGLSTATGMPGEVPPPPVAGAFEEDSTVDDAADDEVEQASLGRLNFGACLTADDQPVAVFLPRVLPIPRGTIWNHNVLITAALDEMTDWPLGRMWAAAVQYLAAQHSGSSIVSPTLTSSLFDMDLLGCPSWWGDEVPLIQKVVFAEVKEIMLPPLSPLYGKVETKMSYLSDSLWILLGLQGEGPAGPGLPMPPSNPSGGGGAGASIDRSLTDSITMAFKSVSDKSTAGRKERERDEFALGVGLSWSLLLAASPSIPGQDTLVLAPLKVEFQTILSASNAPKARRDLHALVEQRLRLCFAVDADRRSAATQWDSRVVNEAFTNCARTFHVLDTPFSQAGAAASTSLSLLQFCPPKPSALQAQIDEAASQAPGYLLESSTRDVASLGASKLYLPEGHFTMESVRLTLLNFRSFGNLVSESFDRSYLWFHLSRIEELLFTSAGRQFSRQHTKFPEVAVNLLMDVQALFSTFVEIARNLTIIEAVGKGTAVAKQQFTPIGNLADNIVSNLSGMLQLCRPNSNFGIVPLYLFDLMQIKKQPQAAATSPSGQTASTPPKRAPEAPAQSSSSKASKADKASSPGTPSASSPGKSKAGDLGFLEFLKDKPDAAPGFGFSISHPTKKDASEYPCPAFNFKGYACDRKKCSLIHVAWRKLSAVDQQQFQTYVESKKDIIQFVKGQGPSGTK